jgi:hypothetical protein
MKHHTTILDFHTVKMEGSLFSADMLEKACRGSASHQSESDYKLPRGIRFTDETGRAFQIASAVWARFEKTQDTSVMGEFLRDVLGYTSIEKRRGPVVVKDMTYPVYWFAEKDVPLVIAPSGLSPDKSDELFTVTGGSTRRKSAFSLMQIFLNAADAYTWAFVTNGKVLRLLRDSQSLVRPSYVEFDLETIFAEKNYAEFCALWRVLHASRVSVWEQWRTEGIAQGTRIRDGLRDGVTAALIKLGTGFIASEGTENSRLCAALHDGTLTKTAYFNELLRLVYRFLFLFTIEERGLLHSNDPSLEGSRELYDRGYSLARLRDSCLRSASHDSYTDQYEGVKIVFAALQHGDTRLDLPALGGLFDGDQCVHIDGCSLENRYLASAIKNLRWAVIDGNRSLIDYRNMGTEEFGSVYESLLELVPVVNLNDSKFGFVGFSDDAEGSLTGNARKTTGSYYTDSALVQQLIKTTLDPVIDDRLAKNQRDKEKALLSITVIDPACGSGHFLLAASRRMAEVLADLRTDDGTVQPDFHRALRDVINHCIYGVDLNPMAVELARTALWLEGYESGRPLGFLDHHLRCGNSLTGVFNLEVLKAGIPNAAYKALTGDDKKVCAVCRKNNISERDTGMKDQHELFDIKKSFGQTEARLAQLHFNLENISSNTLDDIEEKRNLFRQLAENEDYKAVHTACDIWTSAFYIPKTDTTAVPTTGDIEAALGKTASVYKKGIKESAEQTAAQNGFFHWPLEFPEIFQNGGFDCVLANPPWETVELKEKEFFAISAPDIADAKTSNEREKMIIALNAENASPFDKELYSIYIRSKHQKESFCHFASILKKDYRYPRYPLTGKGKLNYYALFAELFLALRNGAKSESRAGFIVPSGIATDDSTKLYFAAVAQHSQLASLYDFENREKIFPSVDSRMKFSLVTLGQHTLGDFAFFLTNTAQLEDSRRHFTLSAEDFALINPNTKTCPVFRSTKDAELTKKIYHRVPVLWNEMDTVHGNPWKVNFMQMFNMSTSSNLFCSVNKYKNDYGYVPLYEAKMIHQFDHRWSTYDGEKVRDVTDDEKKNVRFSVTPHYMLERKQMLARITKVPPELVKPWLAGDEKAEKDALLKLLLKSKYDSDKDLHGLSAAGDLLTATGKVIEQRSPRWLMGFRDICRATDERTVISAIIPQTAINHKIPCIFVSNKYSGLLTAVLLADFESIPFDYIARQKFGGTSLAYFYLEQFPVLSPGMYSVDAIRFIVPRVFELTWTADDMENWAEDIWIASDAETRLAILKAVYKEDASNITADSPLARRAWDKTLIPPFVFDTERRAQVRAELDAYYAKLYGLTRDELRYILDPKDVMGEDYPSETFRVLKDNELKQYGEYRTQRLVLAAWDKMEGKEDG